MGINGSCKKQKGKKQSNLGDSMLEGNFQRRIFDERRDILIVGDQNKTFGFCTENFIQIANEAIEDHGMFYAALSGGSTPKNIFKSLASSENKNRIPWDKVMLFWSDERSVPPNSPDSNYGMAMSAGLGNLGIPEEHIFRMVAENDIEANARAYEKLIREKVPSASFDLLMLGMGDDGHTASLFPHTHGLHSADQLVIANYVPAHDTWRMSLTYACINAAKNIVIYVIGKGKSQTLQAVLTGPFTPDELPIQRVGTLERRSLWIVDCDAAAYL